jgi:uncharacterized membrane protein
MLLAPRRIIVSDFRKNAKSFGIRRFRRCCFFGAFPVVFFGIFRVAFPRILLCFFGAFHWPFPGSYAMISVTARGAGADGACVVFYDHQMQEV